MSVEQIDIFNEYLTFCIKPNPDDSGVRIMQQVDNENKWIMTIIDNGDSFTISNFAPNGQLCLRNFNPNSRLLNRDGSMPPLEIEEQIEINTPYNKKLIVRNLTSNNSGDGVVIAYSDGVCLYGIAVCEVGPTGFRVALAQ